MKANSFLTALAFALTLQAGAQGLPEWEDFDVSE